MFPVSHRRGFTLIELLLVIGIISILAGIVIIAVNPTVQLAKARNSGRQSDINTILNAFGQYLIDRGAYQDRTVPPPADCSIPLAPAPARRLCLTAATDVTCDFGAPNDGSGCVYIAGLAPTYVVSVPLDPQETSGGNDDLQSDYAVQLTDGGTRLSITAPNTEIPPAEATLRVSR